MSDNYDDVEEIYCSPRDLAPDIYRKLLEEVYRRKLVLDDLHLHLFEDLSEEWQSVFLDIAVSVLN